MENTLMFLDSDNGVVRFTLEGDLGISIEITNLDEKPPLKVTLRGKSLPQLIAFMQDGVVLLEEIVNP